MAVHNFWGTLQNEIVSPENDKDNPSLRLILMGGVQSAIRHAHERDNIFS